MPIATPARAPTAKRSPKAACKKAPRKKAEKKAEKKTEKKTEKKNPAPKEAKNKAKSSKKSKAEPKRKSQSRCRKQKDEVERKLHSVTKLNRCSWRKVIHFVFKPSCVLMRVPQVYSTVHHNARKILKLSAEVSKQRALNARVASPSCKKNQPANLKLQSNFPKFKSKCYPKKTNQVGEELGAQRPPCC